MTPQIISISHKSHGTKYREGTIDFNDIFEVSLGGGGTIYLSLGQTGPNLFTGTAPMRACFTTTMAFTYRIPRPVGITSSLNNNDESKKNKKIKNSYTVASKPRLFWAKVMQRC